MNATDSRTDGKDVSESNANAHLIVDRHQNDSARTHDSTENDALVQQGNKSTARYLGDEREAMDSETQMQAQLFEFRKEYRLFTNNSKLVLTVMIILNSVVLVVALLSDFFFNLLFSKGINNRIGSFNDIALITVSILANALNLWFNRVGLYSSLDYCLNIILAGLTLFNLFLTLLVKYTRTRLGAVGIFTHFWCALSFIVGAVLDWHLINYNERMKEPFDEDDGPTDSRRRPMNPDEKHTIKEWIFIAIRNTIKLFLLIFFIFYTWNTMLYELDVYRVSNRVQDVTTQAASYDAFHWVDEDHNYKLHITCYGNVFENESSDNGNKELQPIVLFEHGGFDTGYLSATWIQELYHLNRIQRYCTYERPGFGLSDAPPAPISIAMIADSLSYALIEEAQIKGPFVAVGYDIGGLFTRVFAAKNLDRIHSMMLVESWHEDLLKKNYVQRILPPGEHEDPEDTTWLPKEIERPNELRLWWNGMWSTLGWKLQTSWLLAHHGSKERIMGRDMRYQGKFIRSKFLEGVTSSLLSYKDVVNSNEKLENVITSIVSAKQMVKKSSQWGNLQRELTKISGKTQEWKLVEGGHEVYKYGVGRQETQDVLLRLVGEKDRN